MTKFAAALALALTLAGAAFAQNAAVPAGTAPEQAPRAADATAPAGLGDLEKTTFSCPKAALNAAAREVARYPSEGTYQFSYFNVVSASHHAAYEVRFTSNYASEPVLRFCVAIYCQQGFDPASMSTVALIDTKAASHTTGAGHAANACEPPRARIARRKAR